MGPERRNAVPGRVFGARRGLTLRFALMSVMSLFGLGLLVLVGLNGVRHVTLMREYRAELELDLTRHAIRDAMIEARKAARRLDHQGLEGVARSDLKTPIESALRHIEIARDLADARGDAELVRHLSDLSVEAGALREVLSASGANPGSAQVTTKVRLAALATQLAELRHSTLESIHLADVQMAMVILMRDQTITRQEDLEIASNILIGALGDNARLSAEAARVLDETLVRLRAPDLELLGAAASEIELPSRPSKVLADAIRNWLVRDLDSVTQMLAKGETDSAAINRWITQMERIDVLIGQVLADTDRIATNHINRRLDRAWHDIFRASVGGAAVVVAYLLSMLMIARRLLVPMAGLQSTLMRLARGDLRPVEVRDSPFVDVQAVVDALRVFRADAIRRERLLEERLSLTAELTAVNREMRADLDAAAALQRAQLPRPGIVGPFRISTYFRTSSHLGGDSFDFFRLPDGRVILFQLDVAGHGTAASLAAVAAHTALRRSLIENSGEQSLVDALDEVNANWADELPYFTAIVIGFDPQGATGTVVQAGHPYPLILPAQGDIRRIGCGGLPVGVHDEPGYEDHGLRLGAGDRLFVFSDGIYELKNATGKIFGEERLCAVIRSARNEPSGVVIDRIMAALKSWAETPDIDDDISLIVMERT